MITDHVITRALKIHNVIDGIADSQQQETVKLAAKMLYIFTILNFYYVMLTDGYRVTVHSSFGFTS